MTTKLKLMKHITLSKSTKISHILARGGSNTINSILGKSRFKKKSLRLNDYQVRIFLHNVSLVRVCIWFPMWEWWEGFSIFD